MSEAKWTPGPWAPSAAPGGWDAVREPGGQLVCSLNLNNPANMLLIAAAPDLYEALAEIVAWATDDAATAWPKAHAALTKARGERSDPAGRWPRLRG